MTRNIVITGAASGIGKATAIAFLALGDRVFIMDWNEETLQETYKSLSADAKKDMVYAKTADVSKWEDIVAVSDFVEEKGGCDVLVNCAAIDREGMIHEAVMDDFDALFNVNVRGVFNTCKAFAPHMLEKKKGAIVNIASVSGMGGDYNMPLYCATKGAVIALSRSMAMDYSMRGVRVNMISPSAVKTPMFLTGNTEDVLEMFRKNIPARKLCEPEWCANAIVYLASDQAEHICGVNLPVDGGLSAWNGQPGMERTTKLQK